MQTKEYILTNATELFNRQSVTSTSFRQVAAYLDMSDGNLRYHYKNKETLVLAIYQQMLQELENSFQPEKIDPARMQEEVRQTFRSFYFTMYRYKFMFLESSLLFKQYSGFKKLFGKLMEDRKIYFLRFIVEYKPKGLFPKQRSDSYYEMLAEQIFIISDNWIRYIELEKTTPSSIDKKVEHYIDMCLQLLDTALER